MILTNYNTKRILSSEDEIKKKQFDIFSCKIKWLTESKKNQAHCHEWNSYETHDALWCRSRLPVDQTMSCLINAFYDENPARCLAASHLAHFTHRKSGTRNQHVSQSHRKPSELTYSCEANISLRDKLRRLPVYQIYSC